MNAESIVAVSAAVVALVQLVKWAGLPDHYGPVAVLVLSLFGVLFDMIGDADLQIYQEANSVQRAPRQPTTSLRKVCCGSCPYIGHGPGAVTATQNWLSFSALR